MNLRHIAICLGVLLAATCAFAEVQVIDGKKYECRDGVCYLVEESGGAESAPLQDKDGASARSGEDTPRVAPASQLASLGGYAFPRPRIAQGYMRAEEFIAFLEGKDMGRGRLAPERGLFVLLFLVLLGGLAMNLTPCVLPMVPINLMIIGRSAKRGTAYGLGIALAYGILGVGASVGGLAFGDIQGSPWFNAAVAVVFVGLALALFDFWFIDFSRFRPAGQIKQSGNQAIKQFFPFLMGALSAVLAGACVAPVLISVLLLTTDLVAKGNRLAILLPFVMGVGMALPWPFAGAGMKVLPKPGAWMKWVNRVFGVVVLGFAAYYGQLAIRGWTGADVNYGKIREEVRIQDLETFVANRKGPFLIDCWATWCKNCAAMDAVMKDEKVKKALEPFEVIHVQAEDISELRKVKGFESIKGLPAFVIFE